MNYPRNHFLALVVSLLLWGISFPALKIAVGSNSPVAILYWRYLFSFSLVLAYGIWKRYQIIASLRRHKVLFLLGLFNWAGALLQFTGLRYTSAVKCAVLTQMMVVVVPLLAIFMLRERLSGAKVLAMLLSIVGAVMLSTNLELKGLLGSATLKGDLLTVAGVFFWSFYIIYTRKFVAQAAGYWLLIANTGGTWLLSGLTAGAAAGGSFAIDRTGLLLCLFMALFCTIAPTILYNYSMKRVEASASAIIGPLETVSAVFLSLIFLGERLTPIGILGSLLIVGSVYLVDLSGGLKKRHKSREIELAANEQDSSQKNVKKEFFN